MPGGSIGPGRAGTMERKCVLTSVAGAITCVAARTLQSRLFRGRDAALLVVSRHKWAEMAGELRQRVTRVAKRMSIVPRVPAPREEVLQW